MAKERRSKPKTATKSDHQFPEDWSELIIGLVGAVGTNLKEVAEIIENNLNTQYKYDVDTIHISKHIIEKYFKVDGSTDRKGFERTNNLMTAGNYARYHSGENAILSLAAAAMISSKRQIDPHHTDKQLPFKTRVHIINSLKHPEEVIQLRKIYPRGFYLIGVHANKTTKLEYLKEIGVTETDKQEFLMKRDLDENISYGQRVRDTFHMSDFFIHIDSSEHQQLKESLWRIIKILFGDPYITPNFDEYAMFLAHTASLRSADLSRQVGAVIAKNNEIIGTGANDCPKSGGGLYWPEYNSKEHAIKDMKDGRDYMRGVDANKKEQEEMINKIIEMANKKGLKYYTILREILEESPIRDLTEFGRAVHAEMEALLSCARNTISTRNATMYCTTYPCHNCAKHIIAAGIKRVVYIEPYPKSKAEDLHSDAIHHEGSSDEEPIENKVFFEPFVGIGPRHFFDLFSMHLGSGYKLMRKDQNNEIIQWNKGPFKPRLKMLPFSYLELELGWSQRYNTLYNIYKDALSKEATDEKS